ncbi:right-handed parallel beta-helix repeat-containing protein [Paenibacillus senegalensis]|uniref:right-handed parallel beta-helix repeat-containing protein n=1 Tax=Paenibacillus senegalensis TaxID=1465766 RepID=UPI000289E0EA|nr:right-handed parallel beta-helix repeat-containing protein [Paenibacillus senegalensis]
MSNFPWYNGNSSTSSNISQQTKSTYLDYRKINKFNDVGFFLQNYVNEGGIVTKNLQRNDMVDVTDISAALNNNVLAREGTSFQTTIPNTTYYLDFHQDGYWWWGTGHPVGASYLTVAEVTTDVNGNVDTITDKASPRGGFRLKSEFGLEDYATLDDIKQRFVNVRLPPYSVPMDGTNVLPQLQRAVDDVANAGGGEVYLPNGLYMVDALIGLQLRSNVRLRLDDNAVIKAIPTSTQAYRVVGCDQISDFSIIGGTIQGERQDHIGTTGEWGMGIELKGVSNFTIERVVLRDCWGDGLYIGQGTEKLYCENGKVIDVTCDNNRRQGISFISGRNISIVRPMLKNTNGTAPQAGIDFEPNNANCLIEGITLDSPYTENNSGPGILMALQWHTGATREVDCTIINHKDIGSYHGLYLAQLQQSTKGKITVLDPKWYDNRSNGLWMRNWSAFGIQVDIINPYVINPNRAGSTAGSFGAGILVGREPVDTVGDSHIGNVNIYNPTIRDSSYPNKMTVGINVQDVSRSDRYVKNVTIVDPLEISGYGANGNAQMWYACDSGGSISDRKGILVYDIANTQPTIRLSSPYQLLHNQSSTTSQSITLDGALPPSWVTTVEIRSAHQILIIPAPNEMIYPLSAEAGKGIKSSTIGARVTLRKLNTTSWIIESIVGSWEVND